MSVHTSKMTADTQHQHIFIDLYLFLPCPAENHPGAVTAKRPREMRHGHLARAGGFRESCFRLFVNFLSASQILSHFLTWLFTGHRGALHLRSAARLRLSGEGKEQQERRERTGADGKAAGQEPSGTTFEHHLGRGAGRSGAAPAAPAGAGRGRGRDPLRSALLFPSLPLSSAPARPLPAPRSEKGPRPGRLSRTRGAGPANKGGAGAEGGAAAGPGREGRGRKGRRRGRGRTDGGLHRKLWVRQRSAAGVTAGGRGARRSWAEPWGRAAASAAVPEG